MRNKITKFIVKLLRYLIYTLQHIALIFERTLPKPPIPPAYYIDDIQNRDVLIRKLYEGLESRETWLNTIQNPRAANHGERVAEYTYIAHLLRKIKPSAIMDVGCVMNNPIVSEYVESKSDIYFLNPVFETVRYKKYGYFKMLLSEWNIPMTFPFVTCLSTIEHIGFDNTRYGLNEVDQGWDWPRCIQEVIGSIKMLLSMTEKGGTMVASCPYGCKEFVYLPPEVGVRTAQVLHHEHIQALQKEFGSQLEIITLRLSETGWETSQPESLYEPYGSIGPGASGLILITTNGRYNGDI